MLHARQILPDAVALECSHCSVAMTESPRGESPVRYYCCPRCGRWASTMYRDAVRQHAGARARRHTPAEGTDFGQIKARMDAWIARLEAEDPCAVLGVRPGAPAEQVRDRYRELARQHHPDLGGDPARMRQVNEAYARLRSRS